MICCKQKESLLDTINNLYHEQLKDKIINILKKVLKKFWATSEKNFGERLYSLLLKMDFDKTEYKTSDIGERFFVIKQSIWD